MHLERREVRDLRAAVLALAALAVPLIALGGLFAGGRGIAAAVLAVSTVVVFFAIDVVAVAPLTARRPDLAVPVGLGVYAVKVTVFGVAAFRLAGTGLVDSGTFAVALVSATLVWCAVLCYRALAVSVTARLANGPR